MLYPFPPIMRIVCLLFLALLTGCSKSIRPENNRSGQTIESHLMSGNYSGLGNWVASSRPVDSSATGNCISPDMNKPGVALTGLPARIFVSDDSKGNTTVNFLKNVNSADAIGLYPGPKVVHYITIDMGDHAQDSLGNYYFDYTSKALRVHFSLPNPGGPCTTRESNFSVSNTGSIYVYYSVGSWDFAGSPE